MFINDIAYTKVKKNSIFQVIGRFMSNISKFFDDGEDRVCEILSSFFFDVKVWWSRVNLFKRITFVALSVVFFSPFAYVIGMMMRWAWILLYCAFAPIPF